MADRLVLYGGTFDPVHYGHMITARAVAEARGYEKVVLLPSSSPPHKATARAGPADRLEMLRLASAGDEMFDVCDIEIARPGRSYTFDTLAALREIHGPDVELHWIVGADMLADLADWHRAAEVVDQARIVIALRPPWHERIEQTLVRLEGRFGADRVRRLADGIVRTPLIDICSSEIRRRIASGLPVRYFVCDAVADFIREKGLYRCRNGL
jgi:nicotinate-nucleotide adenylyltransferase